MSRRIQLALACGAAVLAVSYGIRQTFGLFLPPMADALGWPMTVFGLALGVQNLLFGLVQPFTGALADRWGAPRVLVAGAGLYALGLVVMATATTPAQFHLGAGLLVGLGISATGFPVVLGAVARIAPPERRSAALGIASAGASFGQFAMIPVAQGLLSLLGWVTALGALAVCALLPLVLAPALAGRTRDSDSAAPAQRLPAALREAVSHPGYRFLTTGFFVCGFHVAFVAVHLPSYLTSQGMPATMGAMALTLIGFFNIIGTYAAGHLGNRYSKKHLLSGLYLARAVLFAGFVALPLNTVTVVVFSVGIGLAWLGTIPLTSGLVGQIFGVRYFTTLFSVVFMSHQLGAFAGAWLGGYFLDVTGSYQAAWLASIALALAAAALHMPIDQRPLRVEDKAAA